MNRTIAVDFDGTLAQTGIIKSEYLKKHFDISLEPRLCSSTNYRPMLDEASYRTMQKIIYNEESTASLLPMTDALSVVKSLSQNNKLFIVTARSAESHPYIETWLDKNTFSGIFKEIYCLDGKRTKGEVCLDIGASVMIDDHPKHLMTCKDCSHRILFAGDESDSDLDVLVASSWREVKEILQ